ncbi:MAG: hypothetical protein Q9182_006958 [Xanthomendoza sp. 2 TL-2023]
MDNDQLHQSGNLELAYEKCLREHYAVEYKEKLRRLRVQLIILEKQNDDLRTHIMDDDEYIQRIQQGSGALKITLNKTEARLESAQGNIRIKSREIETLKAELSSLHGVTMDSTKLLSEKLGLARELSNLRPEIDHLRSQVEKDQSVLAEKLSLDHQLRTLQIQLETEKRSTRRILAKDGKAQVEDAKFESQLQLVRAELNRESREKQKSDREAREASSRWEAQKLTLESRLASLREKPRISNGLLKETQQELSDARRNPGAVAVERATSVPSTDAAMKSRKRKAAQMLSDTMIGTPGGVTDNRRTKRISTLPGEKSSFSITPYLNRTASAAPESPLEALATSHDATGMGKMSGALPEPSGSVSQDHEANAAIEPKTGKPKKLDTSKVSKADPKVAPNRKKLVSTAALEQVAEEEDYENEENNEKLERPSKGTGSTSVDNESTIWGFDAEKKKSRKLLGSGLGRTLLDEDDGVPSKVGSGARVFGTLSRSASGRPSKPSLLIALSSSTTFGAFSPLKRNRQTTVT